MPQGQTRHCSLVLPAIINQYLFHFLQHSSFFLESTKYYSPYFGFLVVNIVVYMASIIFQLELVILLLKCGLLDRDFIDHSTCFILTGAQAS